MPGPVHSLGQGHSSISVAEIDLHTAQKKYPLVNPISVQGLDRFVRDRVLARDVFPQRNIRGDHVFVMLNPTARSGKVGKEIPRVESALKQAGVDYVLFAESIADPVEREQKTRAAFEAFQKKVGAPVYLVIVGGDGSVNDGVQTIVKSILGENLAQAGDQNQLAEKIRGIAITRFGTAGDLGWAHGATKNVANLPWLLERGVVVPLSLPVITDAEGKQSTAIHSIGIGADAAVMTEGDLIKQRTGKKSVGTFLGAIPRVLRDYFKDVPFQVEVYKNGGLIRKEQALEILGTSNRLLGGTFGIPGAYGDFKLFLIGSEYRSVAVNLAKAVPLLTEVGARGVVFSKILGALPIGIHNIPWVNMARDSITVKPGETVEFRFSYPHWHEKAGQPFPIVTQVNGDPFGSKSSFKITIPKVSLPFLASPESPAVHLHRETALARAELPSVSGQSLLAARFGSQVIPAIGRTETGKSKGLSFVETPYLSEGFLKNEVRRHGLAPYEAHYLIDRYAGLHGLRPNLENVAGDRVVQSVRTTSQEAFSRSMHPLSQQARPINEASLYQWSTSEWSAFPESNLTKHIVTQGFPVLASIAMIYGLEHLWTLTGLDPQKDKELRFAATVMSAHTLNHLGQKSLHVLAHRFEALPYAFFSQNRVHMAGETFVRYRYYPRTTIARDLWRASTVGITGLGLFKGTLTLPYRASVGMGKGLFIHRAIESMIGFENIDENIRPLVSGVSFFAPEIGSVIAPQASARFFNSRPLRAMGYLAGIGYLADFSFGVGMKIFSDQEEETVYLGALGRSLKEQSGEISLLNSVLHFFAPSLANHLATHDAFGLGKGNDYYQQALEFQKRQAHYVEKQIPLQMAAMAQQLKVDSKTYWTEQEILSEADQDILHVLGTLDEKQLKDEEGLIQILREQFPLMKEESLIVSLNRIARYNIQSQISAVLASQSPASLGLKYQYNPNGTLKRGF